jgi:predicted XRE-type DNA-binding protein
MRFREAHCTDAERAVSMSNLPVHTIGSGNVFADLGSDDPDPALAKAMLVRQLDATIASRGLTQKQASELLSIDQADLSELLRGRTRGFSLDRLFKILTLLDLDVDIEIHPAEPKSQGRVAVRVAVGRGVERTSCGCRTRPRARRPIRLSGTTDSATDRPCRNFKVKAW